MAFRPGWEQVIDWLRVICVCVDVTFAYGGFQPWNGEGGPEASVLGAGAVWVGGCARLHWSAAGLRSVSSARLSCARALWAVSGRSPGRRQRDARGGRGGRGWPGWLRYGDSGEAGKYAVLVGGGGATSTNTMCT